jgi:hypothetical protein
MVNIMVITTTTTTAVTYYISIVLVGYAARSGT